MAPSKPAPSYPSVPRASAGRPKIFGGGIRRSTRIEKKSTSENERTKKQEKGSTEAEPKEDTYSQRARFSPQVIETQLSRRPKRKALPSERCLRNTKAPRSTTAGATNRDAVADDGEDESGNPALYHTISEGGPRLKNIAELIVETDTYKNFRIPSNNIIANEDIDRMVHQQMRRLAKDGNLTHRRVRGYLIDSIKEFEACWGIRREPSPQEFWNRACICAPGLPGTWMNQVDGADCRQFFLWLLVYFRRGSGKQGQNELIKAFERLNALFQEEEKQMKKENKDSEVNELVGVQQRLGQPANRSGGRSRDSAAVSRGVAPKRASQTVREDGNIFRWSGDTNMSDFELSGIDVKGLTPAMDVGGKRRKDEDQKRVFDDHMEKLKRVEDARDKQKAAAALEAAAMPVPRPTTQGSKRSSRQGPFPSEAGNLMSETDQQKATKAGRKFSEFEEGEEANAREEEKRRMAAALKRQKLLERHAARGGPTSD